MDRCRVDRWRVDRCRVDRWRVEEVKEKGCGKLSKTGVNREECKFPEGGRTGQGGKLEEHHASDERVV